MKNKVNIYNQQLNFWLNNWRLHNWRSRKPQLVCFSWDRQKQFFVYFIKDDFNQLSRYLSMETSVWLNGGENHVQRGFGSSLHWAPKHCFFNSSPFAHIYHLKKQQSLQEFFHKRWFRFLIHYREIFVRCSYFCIN